MTKPQEFQEQQIIRHDTPYQVNEQFSKGPMAGAGTLSVGRVVWTHGSGEAQKAGAAVTVFADGIGVVAVEAGSLRS